MSKNCFFSTVYLCAKVFYYIIPFQLEELSAVRLPHLFVDHTHSIYHIDYVYMPITYTYTITHTGQTPCSTQDDIQLNTTGLFFSVAGRVEICDCFNAIDSSTCFWATVSTGSATEPWSWKNAIVVCRELGYNNVMNPILQNT